MPARLLRCLGRFLAEAGSAIGTPSGDARGHIRVYANENQTVTRGRNF
jgi:hypothetical protein